MSPDNVRLGLPSTQGQVQDPTLPLAFAAALSEQEDVIDDRPERSLAAKEKEPWHLLSGFDSLRGEVSPGPAVIRDYGSAVLCRPFKDFSVFRSRKAHVLDAKDVQTWIPQFEAAQYVVVQVLISKKP